MRVAPVLSSRDLPAEELQVGVLDGELMRIGTAFCPIDIIIAAEHRAATIALETPPRSIAERHTAAWIYGLIDVGPSRLQLCVDSRTKWRPLSSNRFEFREVVLSDEELVVIGGLPVTTPLRTALDIARFDTEFTGQTRAIVRGLASLGRGFHLDSCNAALERRRNLPNKRIAMVRLSAALKDTSMD